MAFIDRRYVNIVREFTIAGLKLRAGGAVMGFAWTLLHPLAILAIMYMLFSKRIGSGIEHYEIFLLIGILHWNFFSKATSVSMKSIIYKRMMLRNISMPRTSVVVASIIEVFISFLFELVVLGAFIVISGIGFSAAVAFLPFVILIQLILVIGVSLLLSCLNVYFRDIDYIWDIALKIGLFVTPIFYSPSMFISDAKMRLYLLNPLTQIIIFSRDILLFKKMPDLSSVLYMFAVVLVIFLICYAIFKRFEDNIVERI